MAISQSQRYIPTMGRQHVNFLRTNFLIWWCHLWCWHLWCWDILSHTIIKLIGHWQPSHSLGSCSDPPCLMYPSSSCRPQPMYPSCSGHQLDFFPPRMKQWDEEEWHEEAQVHKKVQCTRRNHTRRCDCRRLLKNGAKPFCLSSASSSTSFILHLNEVAYQSLMSESLLFPPCSSSSSSSYSSSFLRCVGRTCFETRKTATDYKRQKGWNNCSN